MYRSVQAILTMALVTSVAACAPGPTATPTLVDPPLSTETASTVTRVGTPRTTRVDALSTTVTTTPEERRAQIETLTKPLWLGWYAAVAAGDVDALGQAVALNRIHADGVTAIATAALDFIAVPRMEHYEFAVTEVLRDDPDCMVIALREDPSAFLAEGVEAERIGVFWLHDRRWYLATSWTIDAPEFAWGDDCSLMVREFA